MLNDEKIITKIKEYDNTFNDTNYVYAVIEGGIKKKNRIISIIIIVFLIILFALSIDSILWCAIFGGIIGGTSALINDYCIICYEDRKIILYLFNKTMSKIVDKITFNLEEIEITKIKKKSLLNTIKISKEDLNLKIVISRKTLGLKNQTENTKRLIEILSPDN